MTHINFSRLLIIGSGNGLSPDRRQAIIWTNAGVLLIRPLGTYSVKSYLNLYISIQENVCEMGAILTWAQCVTLWIRFSCPLLPDTSSLGSVPTSVAWQPGKEFSFVVGTQKGSLSLLDQRSSKPQTLSPHNRTVRRLVFNPESPSVLASTSEDCSVVISKFSTEGTSVR